MSTTTSSESDVEVALQDNKDIIIGLIAASIVVLSVVLVFVIVYWWYKYRQKHAPIRSTYESVNELHIAMPDIEIEETNIDETDDVEDEHKPFNPEEDVHIEEGSAVISDKVSKGGEVFSNF